MHVVGIYPKDGCGVGDSSDCVAPTNVTLAFRFDRFLDPSTVNRQAIRLYTGNPKFAPSPPPFQVVYDPVERVVEFRMPPGHRLAPNALYQLELVVPAGPGDSGIRAFDGAPLVEADLPLQGSFFTSDAASEVPAELVPTCAEIVGGLRSVFTTCTGQACHQKGNNVVGGVAEEDAPHGLWLDDARRFSLSAVNRVARQTEVGDQSGGVPSERSERFGVRMAVVDPRNPAGSYLMYKLLRNLGNFETCPPSSTLPFCTEPGDPGLSSHVLLPLGEGQQITPSQAELERLQEWFVRGAPMPRPRADGEPVSIYLQGLRAVSRFIAAGADCSQ